MEENRNTPNTDNIDLIDSIIKLDEDEFMHEKQQKIEIERLTKATGKQFLITIKSLSVDRLYDLQSSSLSSKGGVHLGKFYKGALTACSEAIVNPNFDDVRLKKKLKLNEQALKIDVLRKVFKPSEIQFINNQIMELSGFDNNTENELKKD